ncbi:MAG: O-antigen ligase family protein [Candidatus Micrarchaeia archaeon]
MSKKILVLIFWGLIGFIIALSKSSEYNILPEYTFYGLLNENISFIGTLVFSLLMISYLRTLKRENYQQYLQQSLDILPLGIFIAIIFTYYIRSEPKYWYGILRQSFVGADPNEFSCILASLNAFILYGIYFSNNKIRIALNIMVLFLSLFLITNITASKAGIIVFIFMIIVFHSYLFKYIRPHKLTKKILMLIIILIIILNRISFEPIISRFLGYQKIPYIQPIDYVTSGRYFTWIGGLKAFIKNPLIGYGGSDTSERVAIADILGKPVVAHNLYLSALLQYGIISFLIFITMIFEILKKSKNCLGFNPLVFPFVISLNTLLFAGLTLNWFKREILWFFISVVSSSILRENINE